MELMIQFKNSFWHISRLGIKRVTHFHWAEAKDTIERLFRHQNEQAERANKKLRAAEAEFLAEERAVWRRATDNRLP